MNWGVLVGCENLQSSALAVKTCRALLGVSPGSRAGHGEALGCARRSLGPEHLQESGGISSWKGGKALERAAQKGLECPSLEEALSALGWGLGTGWTRSSWRFYPTERILEYRRGESWPFPARTAVQDCRTVDGKAGLDITDTV